MKLLLLVFLFLSVLCFALGFDRKTRLHTLMKPPQGGSGQVAQAQGDTDIVGDPTTSDIDTEDSDPTDPSTSDVPTTIPAQPTEITKDAAGTAVKTALQELTINSPSDFGCKRRDIFKTTSASTGCKNTFKTKAAALVEKLKTKFANYGVTVALEAQYTIGPLIRSKQVNFGINFSAVKIKYKSSCKGVYTNIGFTASINLLVKFTKAIPSFPTADTEFDQVAFGITGSVPIVPGFASVSFGGAVLGGKKSTEGVTATKVSGFAVIVGVGVGVGTEHVIPVNFSLKICKARAFTWPWE